MLSLLVLLAKQEVQAFSCLQFIYLRCFHRKGVSRNAEHYGEAQDVITSCFACQTESVSLFLPVID